MKIIPFMSIGTITLCKTLISKDRGQVDIDAWVRYLGRKPIKLRVMRGGKYAG